MIVNSTRMVKSLDIQTIKELKIEHKETFAMNQLSLCLPWRLLTLVQALDHSRCYEPYSFCSLCQGSTGSRLLLLCAEKRLCEVLKVVRCCLFSGILSLYGVPFSTRLALKAAD